MTFNHVVPGSSPGWLTSIKPLIQAVFCCYISCEIMLRGLLRFEGRRMNFNLKNLGLSDIID